MILIDSNIPMYLVGAPHPNKLKAQRLLEESIEEGRDAVHLAVMEKHGVGRIMSFNAGFDGFPGIQRIAR